VAEVRLSRRASSDLDALPDRTAGRIVNALERLARNPIGTELDVKALAGRRPWRRLRIGDHRILHMVAERGRVVLVGRVVDRKDLTRAILTLPE
jgi:mRNA-degrading endonuclease RelE of RelBE toxin-antitoxin system